MTVYGAVFVPDSTDIDVVATKARRAEMRRQGLPVDQPIAETTVSIPPPQDHQHHHHLHGLENDGRRACCARDVGTLLLVT